MFFPHNKSAAKSDTHASGRRAHSWAAHVGPGLTTIASDNDPSGIATYTLAGAWYGFDQLWVCVLSYPSTVALQLIAARIAAITGRGLTANMRQHDWPPFFYFAVARFLIANTFNIAVDVLAMGAALRALSGGSLVLLTLLSGCASLALQWSIAYARYAKFLKWLTLAMFAYAGVLLLVDVPWHAVARRLFVPRVVWSENYMTMLIAVLGTTVSPYLMFAQAEQEARDVGENEASRRQALDRKMGGMRRDILLRTLLSNAVSVCVMIAAAATLHLMQSTPPGDTVQLDRVLEPLAHSYAGHVLALALFGSALLALPPLAGSAAQAAASSFNWETGERRDTRIAWLLVATMMLGMAVAVALAFFHIDPVRALYWSAVLNGMTVTPVLVLLVLLSSSREAVGDLAAHWTLRALSWLAALGTAAALIAHSVLEFL
ncbi:divalent metal cation transporter [Caballeronia sp. LZ062]|uniref:NRAMP family divalent metal transporter n=1 Tax=unclassified Caballeronia TaxID=2646786 RepID=UPI002856301B|nr:MULTISPECIES: divalent metal cation transporter [unclassified Caballeronia]MDR5857779.1 divalent metal cation transporter [Caballeronia sp. LZ050]MDR5869329.1 divalent metal cation transporter [Caballeronia sp. LZ062]